MGLGKGGVGLVARSAGRDRMTMTNPGWPGLSEVDLATSGADEHRPRVGCH